MTVNAIYRPAGPYPYMLPSPPASPSDSPPPPGQSGEGSSSSSSSPFGLGTVHRTKPNESKRRPKISLDTSYTSASRPAAENDLPPPEFPVPHPHHFTDSNRDEDYSSYSALSPLHAKDSPRSMTMSIYNRHLPNAARSYEILPSPLRARPPIPISTSHTHLPFAETDAESDAANNENIGQHDIMGGIDQSQPGRSLGVDVERPGIKRKPSTMTMNTILSSLSNKYGPWKNAERARLHSIQKQKMSNGTANFYFPPEEQPWDPKAIKRLSKVGTK